MYVAQKAALLTDQHAGQNHLEDDVVQLPELGAAVVFVEGLAPGMGSDSETEGKKS